MMVGGSAGLLVAAVAGYWVLERADRHKGQLKTLGQVLGAVIIAVSLIGVACQVWCAAKCGPGGHGFMKGHGMMKGMCPLGAPANSMSKP
jgi:hypothetical protein